MWPCRRQMRSRPVSIVAQPETTNDKLISSAEWCLPCFWKNSVITLTGAMLVNWSAAGTRGASC